MAIRPPPVRAHSSVRSTAPTAGSVGRSAPEQFSLALVRPAAVSDQASVVLYRLAAGEMGPDAPFGGDLDLFEASLNQEPDAPFLELPGDQGGNIVVLAEKGTPRLLDDDDLGAEGPEHEGHLASDDSGADDEEEAGDGVHDRQVVRR